MLTSNQIYKYIFSFLILILLKGCLESPFMTEEKLARQQQAIAQNKVLENKFNLAHMSFPLNACLDFLNTGNKPSKELIAQNDFTYWGGRYGKKVDKATIHMKFYKQGCFITRLNDDVRETMLDFVKKELIKSHWTYHGYGKGGLIFTKKARNLYVNGYFSSHYGTEFTFKSTR